MSTIYVSTGGNDTTGNGTSGSPYFSIEKAQTMCIDGDTISILPSSYYSLSNTIIITKQITVTGVNTNQHYIYIPNKPIFDIRSSNVTLTYLSFSYSANAEYKVIINSLSDGTTIPTFFSNVNISYCTFGYGTKAALLNGEFNFVNNHVQRVGFTTTPTDMLIIHSTRGTCNISNNTFLTEYPNNNVINLTSLNNGTYDDLCSSKGGTLNINNNIVRILDITQSSTIVMFNYFNKYIFGAAEETTQYNPNTKLKLNIYDNSIYTGEKCRLCRLSTYDADSYNMFSSCKMYNNEIKNTDYGVIHLDKNTSLHNSVTLTSDTLQSAKFKIYNNISKTASPLMLPFDTSYLEVYALQKIVSTYEFQLIRLTHPDDENYDEDFYDYAGNGDLVTQQGIPVAEWLSGKTYAYVFMWLNQNRDGPSSAYQFTQSLKPKFILGGSGVPHSIEVKASTLQQSLVMDDTTPVIPSGNSNYTIQMHYKTTSGNSGIVLHSGAIGGTGKIANSIHLGPSGHSSYWNTNAEAGTVYTFGTVADETCMVTSYDGANRYGWVNRTTATPQASSSRNSTATYATIGYAGTGHEIDYSVYSIIVMDIAASNDQVTNMFDIADKMYANML